MFSVYAYRRKILREEELLEQLALKPGSFLKKSVRTMNRPHDQVSYKGRGGLRAHTLSECQCHPKHARLPGQDLRGTTEKAFVDRLPKEPKDGYKLLLVGSGHLFPLAAILGKLFYHRKPIKPVQIIRVDPENNHPRIKQAYQELCALMSNCGITVCSKAKSAALNSVVIQRVSSLDELDEEVLAAQNGLWGYDIWPPQPVETLLAQRQAEFSEECTTSITMKTVPTLTMLKASFDEATFKECVGPDMVELKPDDASSFAIEFQRYQKLWQAVCIAANKEITDYQDFTKIEKAFRALIDARKNPLESRVLMHIFYTLNGVPEKHTQSLKGKAAVHRVSNTAA